MPHYRCRACGNRTRFDVLATRRSRAFHHFDLSGEGTVEEEEVLSLVVESVTCRWCGSSSSIDIFDQLPAAEHAGGAPAGESPERAGESPERGASTTRAATSETGRAVAS